MPGFSVMPQENTWMAVRSRVVLQIQPVRSIKHDFRCRLIAVCPWQAVLWEGIGPQVHAL